MKKLIIGATLLISASGAMAQIGVSIDIGQPGFYGRIDLGDVRQPPVYVAQPIIIERGYNYAPEPVYLRVPPGHRKNWRKHCGRYDACGRRVYFVRDEWYTNTYAPRYRKSHGGDREHHGREHRDRDDRRYIQVQERGHDRDDRGHGGKHKDKGHKGNGKHKD